MNIEQISALVDDRKTLLEALNEVTECARNDHGISLPAVKKIHQIMNETLKALKYESVAISE